MKLFFERPNHLPHLPGAKFEDSGDLPPGPRPKNQFEALEPATITPDFLQNLHESFGNVVSFASRGLLNVSFRTPEAVQTVLVDKATEFLKGEQEAAISAAIGWGLLVDEGPSHRRRQSALSPAFRKQSIESYQEAIEAVVNKWINLVASQEKVPLLESVRNFAQESAEQSLFGYSSDTIDTRYQESVLAINELVVWGSSSSRSAEETLADLRAYRHHKQVIEDHVSSLVEHWRQSKPSRNTLLDYMLEKSEKPNSSFGSLHQQVSLFLQASVETTASLISWALILLSHDSSSWRELVRESRARHYQADFEVAGVTWSEAILKEALRLYPPAWMIPRVASKNLKIEGWSIPEGARVIVSPWLTHRSPDVFEEPSSFLPQRWRQPRSLPRGAYFPFGMGNRICIGERYGKKTAETLLTSLARSGVSPSLSAQNASIGTSAIIINPDSSLELSFSGHFS